MIGNFIARALNTEFSTSVFKAGMSVKHANYILHTEYRNWLYVARLGGKLAIFERDW